MIRFLPDTPLQALTRFFDMAAPDNNVYIEIAAPDLRMGALVLLALAALACWPRLGPRRRPIMAMLALMLVSSVIWLSTTGNGRYFLPLLVCAGPVVVGLLCLLPISREWKGGLAVSLVAAQVFVLTQQPPWHAWSWLDWEDGKYFAMELGPQERDAPPTTYATLSTISYSLIAPQFPANARWVNLPSAGGTPRDREWMDEFLRRAAAEGPIRLVAPSLPSLTLEDGQPTPDALRAFDKLIAGRNLRITGACRLIPSLALARLEGLEAEARAGRGRPIGFWSCPLAYDARQVETAKVLAMPDPVRQSFQRMGELCPRFFPLSETGLQRLHDGWVRPYAVSETRVYVLDNGQVWYKFWRSLNPVFVGSVDELLAGKGRVDCSAIRGSDGAWRSGAQ